jgi:hypothetical protein
MGSWRIFKTQKQGLRVVRTNISQSYMSIRNAVRFHHIYLVAVLIEMVWGWELRIHIAHFCTSEHRSHYGFIVIDL